MKNFFFLILTLFFFIATNAQTNQSVLNKSTETETFLTFNFNQYELKSVRTPKGIEQIIIAKNTSAIMEKGAPDLPKFTESIIVSNLKNMKVEIISAQFTEIANIFIAPSKGNFSRIILPKDVPYEYGKEYNENSFYPSELAKLDTPYIMRDFRGQALQVNPFQYNPSTKILRVYSEIKLRVYAEVQGGQNTLAVINSPHKIDNDFAKIYANHFKNFSVHSPNYSPIGEEGKMLIICYDAWMSQMIPFVNWKNSIGRPTEIVSVSTAGGTAAAIKNYVSNYYATSGLTYLLLVGDAAQVPTNSLGLVAGVQIGGDSDNAYGYVTGIDHYQEFFVGRFSAETPDELVTQVQRTILYEKGDQLASGWLNKIVSVASNQGPGDDNELDYEHLRNIQPDLLGFTYQNPVYEFFDGSQGNFDAVGNPSAASVATALNSGAGIINYVGHGSDATWGTSGFSENDVNNLENYNKLPFIIDVACVNGNFVGQTTFAESWMRAQKNNQPTGSIAICASTINQSWSPPMVAQDEMNDILVGIATTGIKRTFGGIIVNGFFKMNDETSDYSMTDTWTCFGDPSLLVRTDNPSPMAVSHNNVIILGTTNFQVNCNFEGAFATLSFNGQIIASAIVVNGMASVAVNTLSAGQVLTLTVIGFNKVSYINELTVIIDSESYLAVDEIDSNTIDFGQTKNINLSLKNLGAVSAINASAQVSTSSANAVLTNNNFNFGTIASNSSTFFSTNVFTLQAANNLPDQYPININVQMTDASTNLWNQTKIIRVNAPKLVINDLTISDTSGNNNGILDPGETAIIKIEVVNNGHADITNAISILAPNNLGLTINTSTIAPTTILVNGNQVFEFFATANAAIANGTAVLLNNIVTGGISNQYSNQKNFTIVVGFLPNYCQANSSSSNDEFISKVEFSTTSNTSVKAGGYTDFTAISCDMTVWQSYPISITNGAHFAGDQMGCWIDWNYDGDFTDLGEFFDITYQEPIGTGVVIVPNTARIGATRMRIRLMYTGAILACGNSPYGEVEDYTVNVVPQILSTQLYNKSGFKVYPNPNNGNFVLELNKQNYNSLDSIEIFTINGQLILKKTNLSNYNTIDLNVSTGVYFLKLNIEGQINYKKIVVE